MRGKDVTDDSINAIQNGATRDQVFEVARVRADGPTKLVKAPGAPAIAAPTENSSIEIDESTAAHVEDWPEPIPFDKVEAPPPFPDDLFPPWLDAMVVEVARALEVPLDLAGFCALGVLATCFQKRFAVHVDSKYIEPLSLDLACGLKPGERKSPTLKIFFGPVFDFERQENKRLGRMILDAKRQRGVLEQSIAELQQKVAKGKKGVSDEADLASAYDDLDELEIPIPPLLTMDDATPEALSENLARQGGRMTVASAEGAFLEILRGRYSDQPAIEVCLKGHAGEMLKIHRKGKDSTPIIIAAPALSICLCVQPSILAQFGSVESLAGRGLLSRFVFVLPESALGHRKHDQSPVDAAVSAIYAGNVAAFLALPEKRDEAGEEIEAEIISCSHSVQTALKGFSRTIEPELRAGGSLCDNSGYLSGFGGKAPGLAMRIAGLLAMADSRRAVSLEDFNRGVRFVEYAIGHARIVARFVSENPATTEAKRVLAWIERKGELIVKRRDVCKDLNFTVAQVTPVLKLLEDNEYVRSIECSSNPGSGRKAAPGAKTFRVNPHCLKRCN